MSRVMMLLVLLAVLAVPLAAAEEGAQEPEKKPCPPPLPFHTVEGTGGVLLTDTAYICNICEEPLCACFSRPTVAATAVFFGDKWLQAYTVSECLFQRVELSYAFQYLGLGGWPEDARLATKLDVREDHVAMHVVGARAMLIQEGDFGLSWMPAITAGARFKFNEDVWDIDSDLNGAVRALGVTDNEGWDYTATASKTFSGILPKPFILSVGLRNTEAAQTGLLGFSGKRDTVVETSAIFFLTDRLLLAGEYRQKPDRLGRVPGLVGKEEDWWAVALGYIVNDNLTVAFGFTQLGEVMNNTENSAWGVQLKWEF